MKTKISLIKVQAVLDHSRLSDAFCAVYSTDLESTVLPILELQPIKLVVRNNYGVIGTQLRTLVIAFAHIGIEISIAAPQMYLGKGEIPKTTFYLWRQ